MLSHNTSFLFLYFTLRYRDKGPRTKQMENGFQWMWLKFEYDVVKA